MTIHPYQQTTILNRINDAPDSTLSDSAFESKLYNQHKLEHPLLSTENLTVKIKSGIPDVDFKIPYGYGYTPGKAQDYAEYTLPIVGSPEIVEKAIAPIYEQFIFEVQGKNLLFRQLQENIMSDQIVQQNAAELYRSKIEQANRLLDAQKAITEAENHSRLEFIQRAIQTEINRRQQSKDASKRLNPFK